MAEEFLKTDPEAADEELIVESKRAINYLQVQRNYRYVEFLAQGGYGWVSLVYDDTEKRPLAVKCTTDTSEMELTWWPKLQHDTILPLIEYITLDSCTVFIMPAMRKDLWMCVTQPQFYQDELSFGLCRIWLGDVATALNYLHSQNLCHLDLKLDNVFLKDNGRACLGDFSLLSDSREVPAKFHFLELYEPPEYTDWCHGSAPSAIAGTAQFGGDKADMWQYGILALDLLTNLSLSGERSNYFTLWHHDVWPFVQKVLLHKEYMEYLMEDTFQNVFFNDLDFDLCHEFLGQILIIEPNARASAAEAMRHEFVNVEWPQIPASFGMPKQITAHPSKPRGKKAKKKPSAEEEEEGALLGESPSKIAEDVLKEKMEKIQKEKQVRRQSFAAIAGKNPLMIRHNLSGMNVEDGRSTSHDLSSMSDVEVRDNVVIKKSVETNERNNAGNRGRNTKRVVTSISPHKKLQAKVNKDPAKSTSSQLGRSTRSSTEQVTRFLSSSDRNLRGKSPARKDSGPKGKSSSPKASRSPSVKKSPGGRKNSPTSKKPIGSKKSPTDTKNSPTSKKPIGSKKSLTDTKSSPRDDKSGSNPRKSKSPSSKKSPEGRKGSTTVKKSSNDKKSPSNTKDSEKKRSSTGQDNKTKGKTSPDGQKNTTRVSSPKGMKKSVSASDQKDATKGKTSPDDQKNTRKTSSLGDRKKSTRSQIQYRASRPNSARVSFTSLNNTLSVQVVKPGFTVLKVWDVESSIPPDYIQIVTGTAIDPADIELTVGDVICFGSPLVTQEGHSGTWSTSKAILAIHPVSGGAVALNPGQAKVIYSLLNGFSTSTQVTIKDAVYISIEPGNVNQISNLPRAKPYKIYLIVQSNETHKMNNIIGKNCTYATENSMPLPLVQPPFSCELNFLSSSSDISANDLFYSSSGFDIEKGMYYCSIEPVRKIPISEASTLEGQLSLTVHLLTAGQTASLSQQLLLSFLPAFHVQQDELILSDIQSTNHIIISATPAVQRCLLVVPSDSTVLRVKSPALHPVFPASVTFPVELHDVNYLLKGDRSALYIEISCPITKQQVKIPVKVKRLDMSLDGSAFCQPLPLPPPSSEIYYDWYLMMKVAAALLCIIIVYYIIRWITSARRGMVTTQPVFLNSSTASSNGSQSFSPGHRPFTTSPFRRSYSPSEFSEYENLSQPMRLCHLETSPKSHQRRRADNIFR